jgi:acetoin utilization protein AcuC
VPQAWLEHLRSRGARGELPSTMGEGRDIRVEPWLPGGDGWLDRAIEATRHAVFPLLGLDPDDPRD